MKIENRRLKIAIFYPLPSILAISAFSSLEFGELAVRVFSKPLNFSEYDAGSVACDFANRFFRLAIVNSSLTVLLEPLKRSCRLQAKRATVITKTLVKLSTISRTIDGFMAETLIGNSALIAVLRGPKNRPG